MIVKQFGFRLTFKIIVLMLSVGLLSVLLMQPGYYMASLLFALGIVAQIFTINRFVQRTNDDLSRFLMSLKYFDFSQQFDHKNLGSGFPELARTLSDIMAQFRAVSDKQQQQARYLRALLEQVPVPLIAIDSQGQIELHNNSARRLFALYKVTKLSDLTAYGQEFFQHISTLKPGQKQLTHYHIEGINKTYAIAASQLIQQDTRVRLISLQNIQSELDNNQLNAWQALVRVLTHEIMNSITPVASLAKTSTDLIDDLLDNLDNKTQTPDELKQELTQIRQAVDTVARRSDSLTDFVKSYQKLTHLPEPNKTLFNVKTLFEQSLLLVSPGWHNKGIRAQSAVDHDEMELFADKQMIEQILLNLLKNAEHAVIAQSNPEIALCAKYNKQGHLVIEVADNGCGINEKIHDKVFVPFYTTKIHGSGVGLALTRQVMIAHGGSVSFTCGGAKRPLGQGTCFTLSF